MTVKALAIAVLPAVLAACAYLPAPQTPEPNAPATSASGPAQPGLARYRCDNGVAFTARFDNGTAVIDAGARGTETLLRDAGGMTPQQTVYSSTSLKAEFGLEPDGRGAKLSYLAPALEAKCVRE